METDISKIKIETRILTKIPYKVCVKYKIFPLIFDEIEQELTIASASADIDNIETIDGLRRITGNKIKMVSADSKTIDDLLNTYYSNENSEDAANRTVISENTEIFSESAINTLEEIIRNSINERASDIHFEAYENFVNIRHRIDGILYDVRKLPKRMLNPIISRIKILSNLNIAERRLPHDGKMLFDIAGRKIDMRISILPSNHGESAVIRILDKENFILGMDKLGFNNETLEGMYKIISRSHGLILVSGPTGSGKTTTLYSALTYMNSSEKKIITIEDPIEYEIAGIQQLQVKPHIGFTFASGLRSILRHDPDIILVGEIRDSETAKIAIQSALTGHFVFSTVHTNDSPGSVIRLMDMGIENFLISSSVSSALSQRLVRLICLRCKEKYSPSTKSLEFIYEKSLIKKNISSFYRGAGCEYCKNTGYRGRSAIFEHMIINDEIRRLISKSASSDYIREAAVKNGMIPLFDYGLIRVENGDTTISEVLRVCAL